MKTETPKSAHNYQCFWFKKDFFSFNIQNIKNDDLLFSLRNIKIMQKMQKNVCNFSADSFDIGPILDN
jgi:hypothetical protein